MTHDERPAIILIDPPVNAFSEPDAIAAWIEKLKNGPYPDHPDVLRALAEAEEDLKAAREMRARHCKS